MAAAGAQAAGPAARRNRASWPRGEPASHRPSCSAAAGRLNHHPRTGVGRLRNHPDASPPHSSPTTQEQLMAQRQPSDAGVFRVAIARDSVPTTTTAWCSQSHDWPLADLCSKHAVRTAQSNATTSASTGQPTWTQPLVAMPMAATRTQADDAHDCAVCQVPISYDPTPLELLSQIE